MPDEAQPAIATGDTVLTLINTFTCADERQDALVAALAKSSEEVFRHLDGFISASIHASLDRTRVVNYVQWRTVQDFDAAELHPDVRKHLEEIMVIAETADPRLFHVRAISRSEQF